MVLFYYGPAWVRQPAQLLGRTVDAVMPWVSSAGLAISENGMQHLSARWGDAAALIPPGVHLSELEGADPERARRAWDLGQRPWVVYAGNTDPYQDLPVLFAAVGQTSDLGLLVVTGSECTTVHRMADGAGISRARLRCIHSTRFRDTLDALAVGTVAGLPRTHCAGFPIKLLNQLALGLPTVAAHGSFIPIPGVIPVPNHDVAAMGRALNRVAGDPRLRCELSTAARDAIRQEWTWDNRVLELEAFYEQLLAN